jgi:thiol-activated cytolysin
MLSLVGNLIFFIKFFFTQNSFKIMKKRFKYSIIALLLVGMVPVQAQLTKLKLMYNRTQPTLTVNLDNPQQQLQLSASDSPSAVWKLTPVPSMPNYYRIINNETGQNLSFESGKVELADIKEGEAGAMWKKYPITGTIFVQFVNMKTKQRLHLNNGSLQVSDISGKSLNSMWKMVTVKQDVVTTGTSTSTPTNTNTTGNITPNATINKKAVNDYVNSLTYDPRILMAVEGDGGTVLQEKAKSSSSNRSQGDNAVILCTTTNYSLSNNFDEVVIMQPTNGIVYPGALIYADKFLVRGQPRPLTSLPVAPVRLTVDLPGIGENGNLVVKNPSNGSVQTELQKALQYWNDNSAYKEGYVNAARSSSNAAVSFNSEQIGLSLGVNVKWASGEAAAQFSYNSTSSKSVALMMFKQVFYTVTAEPPANPADAFGNITAAQATTTFGNDNPPAYVQSVSYGRIIMFRMETSEKVDEVKLKASLKYAAGAITAEGNLEADYKRILSNSSITYALLGGNAEVVSSIASAQNFKDLEPLIKGKNAVYSKTNPGVPIAYTVRFLKDHQIAKMGFTTDYTKEICERKANLFVRLDHAGGYVAKYEMTYDDNGAPRKVETGEKTAGWSQTFYFPGDATNVTLKGWAMTGLVWDPWGEIYNLKLGADGINKCYKNGGTTLNRNYTRDDCLGTKPQVPR